MSIKRMNYFKSELLTEDDFRDEQNYHVNMRRKHNMDLHKGGIASGLEVPTYYGKIAVIDGTDIYITNGMAIDDLGREIVLEYDVKIPVSAIIPANVTGKTFNLVIYYKESQTDLRDDDPAGLKNTRIKEEPIITSDLIADNKDPDYLYYSLNLAKITLDSNNKIKEIDLNFRRYASSIISFETAKGLLPSTGIVEFSGFTPSVPNISGIINPGFGVGPISVVLGLDDNKNNQVFMGTPDASSFFNLPNVQLGALVDVLKGTFRVGMSVKGDASPPIRVRWWAFRPGMTFNAQVVVSIVIDPLYPNLGLGKTQQFSATVSGTGETKVKWSVKESGGGSISITGLYTAPTTPGTYHIVATSEADPTKSATATVTITPDIAVSINPTSVSIFTGKTYKFTAVVANTSTTGVTWSVKEGAAGGSIDNATGTYTAPSTPGTYHVVATSVADVTKSASATMTVLQEVSISISPTKADLLTKSSPINNSQQFTASVGGSTNKGVYWSVQESGGGTIDGTGFYTAPATAGTYHVVAISAADTSKSATATVTVSVPVSISIVPQIATINVNETLKFTPTVSGTTNTTVAWSVQEANGGSVDNTGLYKAPATSGIYHIIAKSVADPSKSMTAVVTVTLTISIQPTNVTMTVNQNYQFTATVLGSANTTVAWSVQEASGGSINTTGLYTAPATAGTYHVIAKSVADSSKSATATITVNPAKTSKETKEKELIKDNKVLADKIDDKVDKTVISEKLQKEIEVISVDKPIIRGQTLGNNLNTLDISNENLEDKNSLSVGRAFIRSEERPDVGSIRDTNN